MGVYLDAKALTVTAAGGTGTGFTSPQTNATLTVGPNATLLIAVVSLGDSAALGAACTGVTWDGVALTALPASPLNQTDNLAQVAVFGLLNPDYGNQTLSATFTGTTGGTGNQKVYIDCFSFTGTDTTSIANCIPSGDAITAATIGNAGLFTINPQTVTTASGDAAFAAMNTSSASNPVALFGTLINNDNAISGIAYGSIYGSAIAPTTSLQFAGMAAGNPNATGIFYHILQGAAVQPRATHLSKLFSWARAPVFLPYNLALYSVTAAQAPFIQTDWSKSFVLPQTPQQSNAYNINLLTNPIPFGPFDYSVGAFKVPPLRPDATQPLNPNLFTNPIPFSKLDWFPVDPPPSSPPQAFPYNINVFTNTLPFAKFDYPPVIQPPWSPPQAVPYNVNIFTNPIPFAQFDWNHPFVPTPYFPAPVQALNLQLFTNPIPIIPVDYSAITPRIPRAPDQAYYNLNVYTVVIVAAPFVPIDYSKPFFPRVLPPDPPPVNIQLFTNPIPFFNLELKGVSKPVGTPDLSVPYNINIFTNPIPFFNYDTTVSFKIKGFSDTTVPYNVNLYGVVTVQFPFAQYDWSKPSLPRPAPPQTAIFNPNLFTNPIPFAQFYWPLQFNVPQAQLNRSIQTNINLFKNPIPFVQNQYPGQRVVRLSPIPLPPYNPNIYTATVAGTTLHVVKFIGNMGHFMIR